MTRDWDDPKNEILGHTVTEVLVGPHEHTLYLVTESGSIFEIDTYGDCCSESWWADIFGVRQLLGARVTDIAEIPMPDPPADDKRTRQEYDAIYGVRIKTTKGVCDLVFRNSSNGYYGGGCSYKMREPGEEIITVDHLTLIDEDWSA